MKGEIFIFYFVMIVAYVQGQSSLTAVEGLETHNILGSAVTPINDEQVIELLQSKSDIFFIVGYTKQANTDNINSVLNEIHDILSSSSVSMIKFYTVDSEKSVSFQHLIGDVALTSTKLVYTNKGKQSVFGGEFNYDQVSDWVFNKYSMEEKEQINSTIKKQTSVESEKLSSLNNSVEADSSQPQNSESNSNSECKENPINLVRGSVEKLKEEVSKLEVKLATYKKKLENSKMKLPETSIHDIKPINIAISVILLLVIVAIVIVFCKLSKKKKHISII